MSNVIIYDTYNVNVTIENDEVVGVQVVSGFIHDVIAGTNISIDKTDPLNPVISSSGGGSMTYPGAGIPLSTGSAWGTSITDNSANWNDAFSWGNHSGLYWNLSGTSTIGAGNNDIEPIAPLSSNLRFGYLVPLSQFYVSVNNNPIELNAIHYNDLTNGRSTYLADHEALKLTYTRSSQPNSTIRIGKDISGTQSGMSFYSKASHTGSFASGDLKLQLNPTTTIFNLGSDAIGDTYQRDASGYFSRLAAVSAGSFLRSGGVATVNAWSTVKLPDTMSALGLWVANSANTTVNLTATAGQSIRVNAGGTAWEAYTPGVLSSLTAATGSNTINNAANAQEWQWNTLGAGTGLLLSSSSTAAASNTNTVFRVDQTGANSTSTQTTHSGYFSNTKTGTSSTNIAGYFAASGGTTNYAIRTAGSVEITGSSGQVPFYARANAAAQGVQLASDGFSFNPIVSANTGLGTNALRWGFSYTYRLFNGQAVGAANETFYTRPPLASTGLTSEIIDNRLSSERTVSYTLNGTISRQAFTLIEAPTSVAGSVATTTLTNAYTLYVQDLPAAGSNLAYTNKWSAGFAGNVIISGTRVNIANLPTSAAGLATGDLWNNSGVINIA